MILSRPETGEAFERLIAALDAEVHDLNKLGSKVALEGSPRNATKVLRLAGERARFREHIDHLHAQWLQIQPTGLDAITTPPAKPSESRPVQKSPLNRSVPGYSVNEAATKIMVKPAVIREWISTGKLTAFQRVSGTWKILPADLIECYRKNKL